MSTTDATPEGAVQAGDGPSTPVERFEHGAQGRIAAVSFELARRNYLGTIRIPGTIVPILVMPVFFVLAFGGAFGALTDLPGFPTDNILNWMVPFAVLQGASFAGLGAAFSAGRDLETGFYDRLLLAPAPRLSLATGPLSFSAVRALLPVLIVVPVGFLGGARFVDLPLGLLVLVVAAVGTGIAAGLWGLGVVYRLRTQRAGALVQVGIFAVLFLSVGQVPLEAMDGTWLEPVARLNPMTRILTMARSGYLEPVTWSVVWPGLLALAVAIVGLALFAWRGFTKLER